MGAAAPRTVTFAIQGPLERTDLPALCDRICALLTESGIDIALCDVCKVECNAVTVDALARLRLAARRHGCQVRLLNASDELRALVGFMGLANVLPE
jgi:ABC-type transporter Mla MlaB component